MRAGQDQKSAIISVRRLVLLGASLTLLFWIFDSLFDAYVLHSGTFVEQFLNLEFHEVWMRLLIIGALTAFGAYVQFFLAARQEAEAAMKDKHQALSLIDAAFEGIVIHDGHKIIEVNEAAAQMAGYSRAELLGIPVRKLLSSESIESATAAVEENPGEPYEIEVPRKDGTLGYFEIVGKPFTYQGVEVRLSSVRDVTERHRAEAALRDSEERYRRLIQMSPEAIVVHSEGKVVFANPAAARLIGAGAPEDMIGVSPMEFVHPDSFDAVRARAARMLVEQTLEPAIEEKFMTFDGRTIDVEVAGTYLEYQGKPAVQVAGHDITDRKAAQAELAKFKFIVEGAGEEVYLIRPSGEIIYANAAALKNLEYSADEASGLHVSDIDSGFDPEVFAGRVREMREGDMPAFESVHRTKNGRLISKEVKASMLTIGTEEIACAFARDITERKMVAAQVENLTRRTEMILQSVGDGIYGLDADGAITFVNDVACELTGWTSEEVVGLSSHFIWHHSRADGSPYPKEDCPADLALRDGSIHHVEDEVFFRKDGSSFPVDYVSTPIRQDETIIGAVVSFRDITERVIVQKALRESEERFRSLVQAAVSVIIGLLPDGTIFEFNPEAERLHGISRDDALGRDYIGHFIPREWQATVYADLKKVVSGVPTRGFECPVVAADGGNPIFSWNVNHLSGSNGEALGVIAIGQDVTERKNSEQRIAQLARESGLLLEVAELITSSLELSEIMNRIVAVSASLTDVNRCSIVLARPNGVLELAASTQNDLTEARTMPDEGLLHLPNGPIVIGDIRTGPPAYIPSPPEDMIGVLVIPLTVGDQFLGLMILDEPGHFQEFSVSQVRMAEAISRQAAVAIQNAKAYETQANIAATLQIAMLPPEPGELPDLDIAVRYVSATEGARIGGDFYDYAQLPDGRTMVLIGDVSGKGLEAAMDTAAVKFAVKALLPLDPSPAVLLKNLNNALMQQLDHGRFVTMFVGVIDPQAGTLTYGSAGHLPPILMSCSGECRPIVDSNPDGLVLGAMSDVDYGESVLPVSVNDLLVLYTDGLTEARSVSNRMDMFGEEGAVQVLAEMGDCVATKCVDRLFQKVEEYTGGRLTDDLAIMALKLKRAKA